jgi:hypothetical protein
MGVAIAALSFGAAAAQETSPIQTIAAFKSTVSYQYRCAHDVFTVVLGAQNQIASSAETTLYWGIWDSGQTASGAISNIAMLNTLPIQAVGGTPQPNGFPPGTLITKVYRSCSGQSLYLWPASSAARLPNDDIVVRFSDAVEQPLTTP